MANGTTATTLFDDLLASGHVLVADGGMGTSLFALGLTSGDSPELCNVERPEIVESAHAGFVAAGADILLTNTFGANRRRLALHSLDGRVAELNAAAVDVARRAAAASNRSVAVAGSIGPTGDLITPLGELAFDDAVAVFHEQAAALAAAGADALWIETMSSIEELEAAFAATTGLQLPVVTTMSFDTHGKTMMGVPPERLGQWWAEQPSPPAAIGANCGIGPGDVLAAVHAVASTQPSVPVVAKANAGIPAYTKEGGLTYPTAAVDMVDYARLAIGLGARIIGGCCGSTPAHLASIREVVDTTTDTPAYALNDIAARFGTTTTEDAPPRSQRRPSRRRGSRRSA